MGDDTGVGATSILGLKDGFEKVSWGLDVGVGHPGTIDISSLMALEEKMSAHAHLFTLS